MRKPATSETLAARYNREAERIENLRKTLERLEREHRYTLDQCLERLPNGYSVRMPGTYDDDRISVVRQPMERTL